MELVVVQRIITETEVLNDDRTGVDLKLRKETTRLFGVFSSDKEAQAEVKSFITQFPEMRGMDFRYTYTDLDTRAQGN